MGTHMTKIDEQLKLIIKTRSDIASLQATLEGFKAFSDDKIKELKEIIPKCEKGKIKNTLKFHKMWLWGLSVSLFTIVGAILKKYLNIVTTLF